MARLTREELASPGKLFNRRATLEHEMPAAITAVKKAQEELRRLESECDQLDFVIAKHLAENPRKVIKTCVFDDYRKIEYAIHETGGQIVCCPLAEDHSLLRLAVGEIDDALKDHLEFYAAAYKHASQQDQRVAKLIRVAAADMAIENVFGADAVTDSPTDDDDDDACLTKPPVRKTVVTPDDDTGEFEPLSAAVAVIDQEAS